MNSREGAQKGSTTLASVQAKGTRNLCSHSHGACVDCQCASVPGTNDPVNVGGRRPAGKPLVFEIPYRSMFSSYFGKR